jgi:lipopolysaccharide export system protein LptC
METIIHSIGRYTRFVRSTKLLLAALAVILTGAILFYPVIKRDSGVRIAFTSIVKKGPTSQTQMLGARFHGLDKDNQPYNVTAKTATQIDDDTLGLDQPTGDISLKSGAWLSVAGNTGVFRMKEKELDLKGSIEMFDNEGYEFRTERMHVNVGNKTAVTHDEVRGQGPLGKLRAMSGAEVDGNSQVVTFEGPVFVTVYPSREDKADKTQATGK